MSNRVQLLPYVLTPWAVEISRKVRGTRVVSLPMNRKGIVVRGQKQITLVRQVIKEKLVDLSGLVGTGEGK